MKTMKNYQENQDLAIKISQISQVAESYIPKLHNCNCKETVLVENFMDRHSHYQPEQTQLWQQISQIIVTNPATELLPKIAAALGIAGQGDFALIVAIKGERTVIDTGYWESATARALTKNSQFSNITGIDCPLLWLVQHPNFSKMLLHQGSITIYDLPEKGGSCRQELKGELLPFRGLVAMTIRFGETVNGMIAIASLQPRTWSVSDRQQWESVSSMIAIAISQLEKTQQITALQQTVQRQAQYQTLLSWLTCIIDTPLELNQILQLAIEGIANTLQVDRSLIVLLKYADPLFKTHSPHQIPRAKATVVCQWPTLTDVIEVKKADFRAEVQRRRGAKVKKIAPPPISPPPISPTPSPPLPSFWLSDCALCQEAFTHARRPLVIANTSELPSFLKQKTAAIFNPNIKALLIVPLIGASQGRILGFIVLQHFSPHPWQPEELELVELVGAQVSTAIIQTQTLQQVQALVEDRTAQLQRSLDVQAKLYENIRRQVEQLRLLNQVKDEFLSTVSHELRTPLTSMTLAIRMLREPNLPPERRAIYLDILDRQCSQETNLINDLLALQQLESLSDSIESEEVDLKALIQDLAQDFQQKWVGKGLVLAVEIPGQSLCLQTEPQSLRRILLELLTNAGKYSAAKSQVVLAVHFATGEIAISISNYGVGIASEELPHIFDKFRRGTGMTEKAIPGTGLGLALVKSLVKHLRGTITAFSSDPAKNLELKNVEDAELCRTSFTLTLPLFPKQFSSLEE
jgi:signal transduction histidine kinase